jgi:ubiquinone/menaquinone biosynthesis C-methylase UbiE
MINEKRFDAKNARRLDDPERKQWSPPEELIDRLPLSPGQTAADIGAGTGYFALPLARRLGSAGELFAVDVQPEMLSVLQEKIGAAQEQAMIHLVPGKAEATSLAKESVDLALLANVWHELDSPEETAREMARIVRPQGYVAVLDWRLGVPQPPGPPLEHRVAMEAIQAVLEEKGWHVVESTPIWPYHMLLIAQRQ